jgi:hypothetical protein
MKYNKDYYNNEFNFLISELTDRNRSIMDIDCLISKLGSDKSFLIDHKKHNDKVSLNTLRELSKFVGIKKLDNSVISCFIVRSDIDTENIITKTYSVVYELKAFNKVVNKKDPQQYIDNVYTITCDRDLKMFFQPETHNQVKQLNKSLL